MATRKISPVLYVILGISIGILGLVFFLANPFKIKVDLPGKPLTPEQAQKEGLVAISTPVLILPSGKQTYTSQRAEGATSGVTSITYDPLDPKQGSKQTISLDVESLEELESVTITINSDTKSNVHVLKLIGQNENKSTWSTTFTINDSYQNIYNLNIETLTKSGIKSTESMLVR